MNKWQRQGIVINMKDWLWRRIGKGASVKPKSAHGKLKSPYPPNFIKNNYRNKPVKSAINIAMMPFLHLASWFKHKKHSITPKRMVACMVVASLTGFGGALYLFRDPIADGLMLEAIKGGVKYLLKQDTDENSLLKSKIEDLFSR